MRLINADLLYKAMQDAEELARRRVRDTESTLPYPTNLNPAYTRYLAQMDERMKAKKMVADAPTVDAVPVVRCVDCKWFKDANEDCGTCGFFEEARSANHYCGEGEWKDGDGNEVD